MHAVEILTASKTKYNCAVFQQETSNLYSGTPSFFFMSNFQSQCSLTTIVMTANGQHTSQHTLEHTFQENTAKDIKMALNSL